MVKEFDPAGLDAAASAGESAVLEDGRCPTCERKGLPILPVRLAVCQRTSLNSGIPELAAERVAAFTDITLDKSLENGEERTRTLSDEVKEEITEAQGGKANKYILRQLRPGYLYFYDPSNPEGYHWTSYVINEDGMYRFFSVRDNPPSVSDAAFDCREKGEEEQKTKALNACVVTLTHVEAMQDLFYAFTEHPWSREHRKMIEGDAEWREAHMQKINIPAWIAGQSQSYGFGLDELDQVAEFSDGAAGMEKHFWPKSDRQLFTREELQEVMTTRLSAAPQGMKDKGLILGVKDELGVIEELNAYRHNALGMVDEFLKQGDGDNRRKLVAMQAIDAFKENFKRAHVERANQQYEQGIESLEEERRPSDEAMARLNTQIEEARETGDERELTRLESQKSRAEQLREPLFGLQEDRLELLRHHRLNSAENLADSHDQQLLEYYDAAALEDFREDYYKELVKSEALIEVLDADYAFWLRDHVRPLMDRYSKTDYETGLRLSSLLSNGLRGGILAPASASVWMLWARELDGEDSLLRRMLFLNMQDMASQSLSDRQSLGDGDFFGREALFGWAGRFAEKDEALPAAQREERANNYQTTMPLLVSVAGNSLSALAINECHHTCAAGGSSALKSFLRYTQLIYVGDPDVQQGNKSLPLMQQVTLTKGEYHAWLTYISEHVTKASSKRLNVDDALPFIEGTGGNFAVNSEDNDTMISVSLPVFDEQGNALDIFDAKDVDKRSDELWQNARDVTAKIVGEKPMNKTIAAGLVTWNAVGTVWDELTGEADADMLKLSGAIVNLGTSSMQLIEEYAVIRSAAVGPSGSAAANWVGSGAWALAKPVLSVAAGVLSIVDGFKKLSEAAHGKRLGIPDSLISRRELVGGATIAGGVLGLIGLAVPALGIPAVGIIIGVVMLVLAFAFVELVAPAAGMWIDRSILGYHRSQLEKFEDANQELASLDMVFKGVTVELTWVEAVIYKDTSASGDSNTLPYMMGNTNTTSHASGYPAISIQDSIEGVGKRISLKVSVPKLEEVYLSLDLVSGGDNDITDDLYKYSFLKDKDDSSLKEQKSGGRELGGVSVQSPPSIKLTDTGYEIEVIRQYSNESLGNNVRLTIEFLGGGIESERRKALFEMHF